MNTLTIIVSLILISSIEITKARPSKELSKPQNSIDSHDNRDSTVSLSSVPSDVKKIADIADVDKTQEFTDVDKAPESIDVDKKPKVQSNDNSKSTNYYKMEDFVVDTIRRHLHDQEAEFESMSDETEQQLIDMFYNMDIDLT